MCRMRYAVWVIGLAVGSGMKLQAQTAYTVTEVTTFGTTMTRTVYRDGTNVLIDESHGPDKNNPNGFHVRIYDDLATHRDLTWDLINTAGGCGAGTFSGDWGDPFEGAASAKDDLMKIGGTQTGTETVNGIATKVYEATTNGAKVKAWFDATSGMPVKEQMTPPGGATVTMLEVKHISMTAPPASVFVLPASCAAAAATPPPPTQEELISAEVGGDGADYAQAIMPPDTKPSACSVSLRVVRAGTMEPIVSGFQIAVDLTYDQNHPPHYTTAKGANGKQTVSGGGIKDMTGQMKNGALRLDNTPAYFYVETYWGDAGESSSQIYKQCFGPQTTLLFVVKDPSNLGKGGDWLWAKAGKFAGR